MIWFVVAGTGLAAIDALMPINAPHARPHDC
jgi:hypothetical protein